MPQYPVHAAKTQLSRLIEQALSGEEVIISRGATPVVRLVPIEPPRRDRTPGSLKGRLVIDATFFEPLSDDEQNAWES